MPYLHKDITLQRVNTIRDSMTVEKLFIKIKMAANMEAWE